MPDDLDAIPASAQALALPTMPLATMRKQPLTSSMGWVLPNPCPTLKPGEGLVPAALSLPCYCVSQDIEKFLSGRI